ncbi:MAG: DUF1929 domain-containing protein, partial [Verrucomicrobiaceae bacterium]|nr:DUF1929 domain-containing protein [Verrucomicrobiaceae bacterium]
MNSFRLFFRTVAAVCATLGVTLLHAAQDDHGFADKLAAEAAALLPMDAKMAEAAPAPPPPGEKSIKGEWTAPIAWTPHIPTTAAVLPDGRLLTFASNQRTTFPDGLQFTYAAVWNPATGQFTEINNDTHDMFCGGVAMLQDGRLHVAGGNGINSTTPYASVFDWRTNQWTRVQTMAEGRWYNTSVALPNGEVLTASGNAGGGGNSNGTIEQWNTSSGWRAMSGIPWASVTNPGIPNAVEPNWHPFLLVAPDGRLAHFGPYEPIRWLNTSGTGSMTTTTAQIPGTHYPKQGSWAMYDTGKVVVMGGYTAIDVSVIVNTAFKVDLNNSAAPAITATNPMANARSFANAVVLPNGEVMVVGGNTSGAFFSDAGTVYTPEVWNPVTEAWRPMSDMSVPRNYHSLALLLTDGRVWSGGGGLSGDPVTDHQDAQVFTPPQLFNADDTPAARPQITAAPDRIGPGAVFSVNASPGVQFFSFIRLASLTHSVTTDQRFVKLTHTSPSSGVYALTAPSNVNVLTPGYWMLYAVDSAGVWSVSRVIQVTNDTLPVVTNPGQQSVLQNSAVSLPINASTGSGTLSYSASSLPAGLSINTGTGLISGTLTAAPGTYQSTVFATANGQTSSVVFKWIVLLPNLGSGQITREWWTEIPGRLVTDLTSNARYPASPNGSDLLGSFETPSNWQDDMGQRVRGYLHPPVTGQYRFYIASDDSGSLRLSTSANPANAVQIASQPDWTEPRAYTWYPQQTSALITLNAGTAYYIEALMKEGNGGDHLSVAWLKPGDSTPTVINGTYLSPFQTAVNQSPVVTNPGTQTSLLNASISLPIVASDPEGSAITYSATGLPSGLAISPSSGVISGTTGVAGTYNVVVTVSDGVSTPGTAAFTWNVSAGLTLGTLSSTPKPVNTAITFTASASNGVNPRFKWNFGDGSPETAYSTNPSITKTYTAPGRYNVTLTATDDSGVTITRGVAQGVHAALTATKPASSSSIAFEDLATGNDRVWCVNPDNNSVSGFDAVTLARVAEINVGTSPRALAFAPNGRLWVVNTESNTISIINTSTFAVTSTITLARGSRPWGLVFHAGTSRAWLALEGTNRVLRLSVTTGSTSATINLSAPPRHLSVSADGTRLYATRFITPPVPNEGTATPSLAGRGGEVVVIGTSTLAVERTILLNPSTATDTETSSRGLPNYLGAAVISPDGLSAWVPSKQDNIQRGTLRDGSPLNHENTVRAIVSRLDLAAQAEHLPSRIDIDNAGMPAAAAFDPWGIYVFTALEASRDIAVLDAWTRNEIIRFPAGRAPQGLVLSPDGLKLYAHNFMDRTITVHNVASIIQGGNAAPVTTATLNCITTEKLSAQVLQGKKLFYDAKDPRLARQEYMSCATCHNDGGHDGRVWDLTGFGEGLRNTITLRGHGAHGLLHWSANFDEVQDFEGQIRNLAGGTGLITTGTPNPPLGAANAGRSADLDALAAYVTSLTTEQNSPNRSSNGSLTTAATNGQQVFRAQNCAACHGGANFTNNTMANVGTI